MCGFVRGFVSGTAVAESEGMKWNLSRNSAKAVALIAAMGSIVGCGADGPGADQGSDVHDGWLEAHARADQPQASYVASLGAAPPLAAGDYLLLDAAPQCDVSRLGMAPTWNDGQPHAERPIIAASLLGAAPLALCTCTDFEASNASSAAAEVDGGIGANGEFLGSAKMRVGGALVAAGAVRVGNALEAGALSTNGFLVGSDAVKIDGNALVGGLALGADRLSVNGSLTVPAGTDMSAVHQANSLAFGTPNVAAPCNCGADVDYDALRVEIRTSAAKAEDAVSEETALSGLDRDRELHLGHGAYYFSSIESSASLTINTHGNVQIFVDGDVLVAGDLRIEPERGSRLSLYVAGRFAPAKRASLAETASPDALRLYVRDQVDLSGKVAFNGSLFAPRAAFLAKDSVETVGALFARSFRLKGSLTVKSGPRFTGDACLVWNGVDGRLD